MERLVAKCGHRRGTLPHCRLGRLWRVVVYLFPILADIMKSRRARWTLLLLFLLAAGWLGWWKAGWPVARLAAGRIGGTLIEKGQGKITDPALFIYNRGLEGFLLATTGV